MCFDYTEEKKKDRMLWLYYRNYVQTQEWMKLTQRVLSNENGMLTNFAYYGCAAGVTMMAAWKFLSFGLRYAESKFSKPKLSKS